ncbi:cytochrome-c peroxidase [Cesiribacter sp. SM1]|uniref:cytochrome-c peroxidase n=1 Tax=Cesiribacter sp. SM1 TaxID=2861196 RepID=UPI001CD6103D|nr:cytochrome c peroxidase [Cesiribacter sp. SM1]
MLLLLSGIAGGIFSFTPPALDAVPGIKGGVREFYQATNSLKNIGQAFKFKRITADSLQATLSSTRLTYKKIEFILAYYYPEYVESHINGAPLLHLESENSRPVVMEPEGLQVLDELVFAAEVEHERVKIAELAQKLETHAGILLADLDKKSLDRGDVVEAMRLQLVRLFTLGLTGFDTPGSQNALQEAAASLESLKEVASSIHADKIASGDRLFQEAIISLQQTLSFNSFDRLSFLKTYINPLYQQLGQLQKAIDTADASGIQAWNRGSNSLFDEDFLDPYYFTALGREEDSPALRNLGKVLFYDPSLSQNGKMSCASCHNPQKAFADGEAKSLSLVEGKTVERNAPTLINAVYASRYFYDMRAFNLEQQAAHVIFNEIEFNTAHAEILAKLKANKQYRKLFKKTFGNKVITRDRFSKALASYVLSLRSFNSPFDQYVRGETSMLDEQAKRGFNLFMGKAACGTCHFAPTFSGLVPPLYMKNESEILGVLQNPKAAAKNVDPDEGRLRNGIFREEAWIYEKSFKTTTVRNAALTAPYFHNGAYETLEEVVDFYDTGGGQGQGLEVVNQTLSADSLHLTKDEKEAIIAFIRSLNDVAVDAAPATGVADHAKQQGAPGHNRR